MSLRRKLLALLATQKKTAEYTELEYLESDGNQYLNLDYIPTAETGLHIKVSTVGQGDMIICGSRNDTNHTRLFLSSTYSSNTRPVPFISIGRGTYMYLNLDGTFVTYNPTLTVPVNTVYEQYTNYKNSKVTRFVDSTKDITSVEIPELTFTPNQTLYLFAGNVAGVANYSYKGKIYSCEITEGDKIVREFIPVLDKNFTPCMYDKVSGRFFYNQGTGEFKWKLPNQLEYIGNEEYCFIEIPLTTKALDVVEIEQEVQYTNANFNQAEIKNGDPYFFMGIGPNLNWYAGSGNYGTSSVKADTEWHTMRLVSYGEEQGFWLDGTRIVKNTSSTKVYLPDGFQLWRCWDVGHWRAVNRKKYVKATVNGKIEYYLIPVLDENLTPCMYDLVSKKYFYNAGSGSLKYSE